ncbi:exonuclease domain-containing protein [Lactobacillus jensenii]|jgi:DNA polymerase-3 subunit epsilon|uniref:exonuclease domain-containing protein n=1 Tax=Lactobacillus jensenii TaxID=109790 RepID=UPI0012477C75|nr:exonuclease domain-containing protein [Lactobacillus jensenii]KAA9257814.1 3'-5' exonuclease [Lactobacillus jensenii]
MTVKIVSGQLEFSNQDLAEKLRKKGRELVEFLDDYTMLDIETTGLSPYRDRVTELAGIKVRNGKVVDKYSQLVKHPKNNKVPQFITKLNGIDEKLILTQGIPVKEAITDFRNFIGEDVIVGYNVNFDLNFIYDLCEKFNLERLSNNYIDVLHFSRVFFKKESHNRLLDCIQRLGISESEAHRGLKDSLDTKVVFDIYQKQFTSEMLSEVKNNLKNCILTEKIPFEYLIKRNPFKNKNIVFSGSINEELPVIATNMGGCVKTHVDSMTNYLVMGNQDFFSTSNPELQKARSLIAEGNKISRISESFFLDMLDSWARS